MEKITARTSQQPLVLPRIGGMCRLENDIMSQEKWHICIE